MPDYMIKEMPVSKWDEAVPLGNGKIGALLFGGIFREKIVLNHERLYNKTEPVEIGAISHNMEAIRKLILEGQYSKAEQLYKKSVDDSYENKKGIDPYQPLGFMYIGQEIKKVFSDYIFKLDFKKALAEISWKEDEVLLKRSTFISYDEDVICVCIEASEEGYITARVNIEGGSESKGVMEYTLDTNDDFLVYKVKYPNGSNHGAVAYIKGINGIKTHDEKNIRIKKSDKAYIFVKTYVNEDDNKAVSRIKKQLLKCDYEKLRRSHTRKWKQLYGSVVLDIGQSRKAKSNEQLLKEAYNQKASKEIIHTLFNYGRYLLISSSKKGGLPANLQGIWNGDYNPAWSSDFHLDENIQMNYWAALSCGLNDCTMPFYDYFEQFIEDYRQNAKRVYGAKGILLPLAQTTDGKFNSHWISASGWIAQHYFDYWLYTADDDFLVNRAIPFMKQVVQFYEDYLIMDNNGTYMFVPSYSPENTPVCENRSSMCVNATMDVAIAKEVLTNLIYAYKHLDITDDDSEKWQDMLSKMPEYMINEDGAFKEWLHEDLKDNYYHRHQSHIYPLFPGYEITKQTSLEYYEAIEKAVDKRLLVGFSEQTGWSYAHMANIYARLENGYKASMCLSNLIKSCVKSNLFTFHNDWRGQGVTADWFGGKPPFQIDANFGFTAAVMEILLFSKPGYIRILPALDENWEKGLVKGIRTRCACSVDIKWDIIRKYIIVTINPIKSSILTLDIPMGFSDISNSGCKVISKRDKKYVDIEIATGATAVIEVSI